MFAVWQLGDVLECSGMFWKVLEGVSDLDDKLGVRVGEALELGLVEVHDEELISRGQLNHHLRELLIKVPHILAGLLRGEQNKRGREREKGRGIETE